MNIKNKGLDSDLVFFLLNSCTFNLLGNIKNWFISILVFLALFIILVLTELNNTYKIKGLGSTGGGQLTFQN